MKKQTRALIGLFVLVAGMLPARIAIAQTSDPSLPGPRAVSREEYDFGDTAFTPPGFPGPVELRGSVHYPTDLNGPPHPLIVLLHGRHSVCFVGTNFGSFQWPCPAGQQSIPSYKGYDYVSSILASNGYIVISISANGINAADNSSGDLGALARAQLIQKHLDIWNNFTTVGGAPFGSKFIGKVNMQRVGVMGHSRGGEGAVRHFQLNQSLGSPYGVKAVFALAPVDFSRFVINNVPLAVLLPYCDGDVSDLQGVHFYDDARYNVPGDMAPKHTILVLGTNHNFYNSIWTPAVFLPASDDWSINADSFCGTVAGNGRLTDAQQRSAGLVYMSAFFRVYVGGESQFLPLLTGAAPPPPTAGTPKIFVSYHAADKSTERRDVNRLLDQTALVANTVGGLVTPVGLIPYDACGGAVPETSPCLATSNSRQPHTTPSLLSPAHGLSQLTSGWNAMTSSYTNDIPIGQGNVSAFAALQFRASVNFTDGRNTAGQAQDFTVSLTDGSATTRSATVSAASGALFFPPGTLGPVPKVVLNTIRMPLSLFAGVNLADIRTIQFKYNQRATGALLITDIAFTSNTVSAIPSVVLDKCLVDDSSGNAISFNSMTGDYTVCCGLTTMSGRGTLLTKGGLLTITDYTANRRVTINLDSTQRKGSASVQSPPGVTFCTIIDRDITNSTCTCGGS